MTSAGLNELIVGMSQYGYGAIRYVLRYMYHDTIRITIHILSSNIWNAELCRRGSKRIYYNIWGNTYHDTMFSLVIHIVGAMYRYIVLHWWIVTSLVNRGVMIQRCIAMHRYFVTTIPSIRQTQCIAIHKKLYTQVFLNRINRNTYFFFLIRLMEILWYYSAKSRFGSIIGSCSSRYSIHSVE